MKRGIRKLMNRERALWRSTREHSRDYERALNLDSIELEALERSQGHAGIYPSLATHGECSFLALEVYGEEFALFVKHVCGAPYGGTWENVVMAVCTSNGSLNQETGGGTTLISVLPTAWHQHLVEELRNGK